MEAENEVENSGALVNVEDSEDSEDEDSCIEYDDQ